MLDAFFYWVGVAVCASCGIAGAAWLADRALTYALRTAGVFRAFLEFMWRRNQKADQ